MSILSVRNRGAMRVVVSEESQPLNTLLLVMLLLLGAGLVVMTSASMETGNSLAGDPLYFFKRQVFFIAVSLSALMVVLHIDMKVWYRFSPVLLSVAIVLLVLVLIPDHTRSLPLPSSQSQRQHPRR